MLLECSRNVLEVLLECIWNGLECIWNALGALLECIWSALGMHFACIWNALRTGLEWIWNGLNMVARSLEEVLKAFPMGRNEARTCSIRCQMVWNDCDRVNRERIECALHRIGTKSTLVAK